MQQRRGAEECQQQIKRHLTQTQESTCCNDDPERLPLSCGGPPIDTSTLASMRVAAESAASALRARKPLHRAQKTKRARCATRLLVARSAAGLRWAGYEATSATERRRTPLGCHAIPRKWHRWAKSGLAYHMPSASGHTDFQERWSRAAAVSRLCFDLIASIRNPKAMNGGRGVRCSSRIALKRADSGPNRCERHVLTAAKQNRCNLTMAVMESAPRCHIRAHDGAP